jgi:hypothetical protein
MVHVTGHARRCAQAQGNPFAFFIGNQHVRRRIVAVARRVICEYIRVLHRQPTTCVPKVVECEFGSPFVA